MIENRFTRHLLALTLMLAANTPAQIVTNDATGVTIQTGTGLTRVEVWGNRTARILHTPTSTLPVTPSLTVTGSPENVTWQFQNNGDTCS